MTDYTLPDKSYPHLRKLAAFLLEHHLEETAECTIKIARQVNLPLLKVFAHLSHQEFKAFVQQTLEEFYRQLVKQRALEHAKEMLRKWRTDSLPNIPRGGVAPADLVLVYSVRKQMMLAFTERYTQSITEALAIARELDFLYAEVEQYAFGLYVDLKEEEYTAFNEKLQEQQAELEEAYEELMTSREELQQTNEDLKEESEARRKTEEALEKERNFLKAILEHIYDGIVACDEKGLLSFFNKATRQFHGLPEKALPAEEWASYYSLYRADGKTPLPKEEIPLYRAFNGEIIERVEMVVAPEHGIKRILLANGQPLLSSGGEKLGAVVVMHDITELKKAQQQQQEAMETLHEKNQDLAAALEELQAAEEQLLEANSELQTRVEARTRELAASEQQMRLVTDSLPVLITFVDAEEKYRFVNKTYEKWFGVPPTQVLGKKLEQVFIDQLGPYMGADGYQRVKPFVRRTLNGETLDFETTIAVRELGERNVSINYVPYNHEGRVQGYFALITDITERKAAEDALKESEERFRLMADAAPVIIWMGNAQGENIYFNPAWSKLTGRRFEDDALYGWEEVLHPDDLAYVWEVYGKALEKQESFTLEFRLRRHDGEYRWLYCQGSPRFNASGEFLGFVGICDDITDRKKAYEALSESEDRFRTFANNIQNLAWMAEPDGSIFWYNQRWYDYTGTTFEEMQGWGWEKVHHPDHKERVLAFVKEAWPKGETWELTFPLRSANGEWGWFLTRAYAVKDSQGKVIRWIGTNTDITEQIKAQQELQKAYQEINNLLGREQAALQEVALQQKRLTDIFMQAPVAIGIYAGKEHVVELLNPLMCEMLDRPAEEILGKPVFEALPEVKGQGFEDVLAGVFNTGEPFLAPEIPATLKRNGELVQGYFNTVYQPLRNVHGEITAIIQIVVEVTEQVEARHIIEVREKEAQIMAEELAATNEELQAANEEIQANNEELNQTNHQLNLINADLDNFIYTASHDLRAPIANIEGLMHAMMRNLPEDNRQQPMITKLSGLIDDSIERFKRTINDLTQVTKVQREGNGDDVTLVDFEKLVEEVKLDLNPQIEMAEAKFEMNFGDSAPVQFSNKNARSIVYNLLSNAIKYRSPERQLHISICCYRQEDFQVFSVQDNGLGMDLSEKSKIFAMFKRLHTHVEGSGIGLYIVKKIVENAGGKIEVESQVGVGSTFKVYFKC